MQIYWKLLSPSLTGLLIYQTTWSCQFCQCPDIYGSICCIWCLANFVLSQHSFPFSPQLSFSQIDYFLLDNKPLPSVSSCSNTPIAISDYAVVKVDFFFKGGSLLLWRFNSLLLSDREFIEHINSHNDLFVSTNVTPEVSTEIIWEFCKAFFWGDIKSYSAHHRT